MTLPHPLLVTPGDGGWGWEREFKKNRVVIPVFGTFDGVWPFDVHHVGVRGAGGGASGAKTNSTTRGAGGGSGAQSCVGVIDVTPGARFSLTVGAGGAGIAYPADGGGSVNGNNGSNSTLTHGNRPPITLLGGNAGLANGNGGPAAGPSTYVSLTGLTIVQGAAGGNAQDSGVGLPGADVDVVKGGLGGNVAGGGGGGASFFGKGTAGGNYGVAATVAPVPNTGAGSGGGGGDSTTVGQYGSVAGADGFWELEYWTNEEDPS